MAIRPGKGCPPVTQFGASGLQGPLGRSNLGFECRIHMVSSPHSASPPCRFATAGYPIIPPCKDRRAAAAAPSATTPPGSSTGVGMRPRPEIEREFNFLRYRNLSGSLGCTVPGHPRCAAKGGRFCAIYLANYLPSPICHPSYIICCKAFAFCAWCDGGTLCTPS